MTTKLDVTPNLGTRPWADLQPEMQGGALSAQVLRIGLLPEGTSGGRASVALALRTPDGKLIIAETTLDLFAAAARALCASPLAQEQGVTWW